MASDELRVSLLGEDMELSELENLTTHECRRAPAAAEDIGEAQSWPHAPSAKQLVDALFDKLTIVAEKEQQRWRRLQFHESTARQQRRQVYLDPRRCRVWRSRSRAFLARRSDISAALSTRTLYSVMVMQHLMELDAESLRMPAELRLSEDTYTDGVSDQFLLDAPRCRYTVDGELFHLAASTSGNAGRDAFAVRLTKAIRRLVPETHLLTLVTTLMSQSGLAALERSSFCGAAVSGGRQEVDFELQRDHARPDRLVVTLRVGRRGFCEYIPAGDDAEPALCDASSSSMRRSAILELVPAGAPGEGPVADVVSFLEENHIRGSDGLLVSAVALGMAPLAPEPALLSGGVDGGVLPTGACCVGAAKRACRHICRWCFRRDARQRLHF